MFLRPDVFPRLGRYFPSTHPAWPVALAAKEKNTADKADTAIITAFEKAGFKNIVLFDRTKDMKDQPNCTVLTYKRWLELGRVVKKGERAIRARNYHIRLFHRDQTEPASADKLPMPSPVETPTTTPAPEPRKSTKVLITKFGNA
jgi:hypothetical protein